VAGAVATVCMNPLDLIKVQFQVDTSSRKGPPLSSQSSSGSTRWKLLARKATGGDVLRDMGQALRDIVRRDGYVGLYRGLSPNVVGNSASWGLYFLWYTMIKEYMSKNAKEDAAGKRKELSAGQLLLAASESGAVTALMTNPIWVVKTRMFTTSKSGKSITPLGNATIHADQAVRKSRIAAKSASEPETYRGLLQGLRYIWRHEGLPGLYKGAGLALVGVSNGAIQFVCYEKLKRWRMNIARSRETYASIKSAEGHGRGVASSSADRRAATGAGGDVKLDNTEYIIMSGLAKLAAIGITYPYQVVRSRIQNHNTTHLYPNIPTCIRLTWQNEGYRGFYKGMAANALRILPGTCVTFVVYENCSWALRGLAEKKEKRRRQLEHGSAAAT
jgi:solute carrier family 25 folate transporter 32